MEETKEQWMKRIAGQQAATEPMPSLPHTPPTKEQILEYHRGLQNFKFYDPDNAKD